MTKYILVFLIIFLGLAILTIYQFRQTQAPGNNPQSPSPNPSPPPQVTITPSYSVTLDKITYDIYYKYINDDLSLTLIPNFIQKDSFIDIVKKNNCQLASNGGFYTVDNEPLGAFKTNDTILTNEVTNSRLLTGFLSLSPDNTPTLSNTYPNTSPLILQSGPLFLKNQEFKSGDIEYARRSIIAKDQNAQTYLLFLTIQSDIYNGPLLSQIPRIIFADEFPLKLTSALNLDGGSASAYFDRSANTLFSEISSVGSVLCFH